MEERKLSILLVASEVYPFAKVGGLADMVSALAALLKAHSHEVRIVIPKYSSIIWGKFGLKKCLDSMCVWMGNCEEWCSVFEAEGIGGVQVFFIEHNLFFEREGIYHDFSMKDYDDNPRRFGFLSRAALQLCKDTGFKPDIVHCHDWQTAAVAAYLKIWHWNDPVLGRAASVLTIHNIAHQGVYPKTHIDYLGFGWHNFTQDKFEAYDKINLLKGGIYYADYVTTVSPTHAKEITTPFGGFGLAPYLCAKGDRFKGILNGIDYSVWNPEKDPLLKANYSMLNIEGKKICKTELQKTFDLEVNEKIALIGIIGRFVEQKGFGLLVNTLERILNNMIVQFVVLGNGEQRFESYFWDLPKRYSGRVGSYIGFDNTRAHLIEAGSDFFLMPSLFEPCGLSQMYSMRYGTLPIVRATGGLEDTVKQYDENTGEGTGFKFYEASENGLYYTVGWAISTYYDRPHHIKKMIANAMKEDFSWEKPAKEYEEVYLKAIESKKEWDERHKLYYW
ncbi:MAG: glycogen synthase GlgA [Chitinispirillaceae bacterium]|nr:glycogen synthase GlgA [Chitinispirillaceae bacterium]